MVNIYLTTITRRHASSWELAADIDRIKAAKADCGSARLTDSSALTIAAEWQSPGYQGRAFAALASTGSVNVNALTEDILHAWSEAKTEHDRDTLDLLLLWAYHHPSAFDEDEDEER